MAVSYTQELLDRATAYVGQPLNQRRYADGMAEIGALYALITGQPVGKCQQCQYSDFLAVITAYIRSATRFLHPELMPDSKYALAPGFENETFSHEAYAQAVTADTLTDEAAEFFIGKGFAHAFVKKNATKSEPEGDKKPAPKLKADYQAIYKELFGADADDKVTVEDLKVHIAAKEADPDYVVAAA